MNSLKSQHKQLQTLNKRVREQKKLSRQKHTLDVKQEHANVRASELTRVRWAHPEETAFVVGRVREDGSLGVAGQVCRRRGRHRTTGCVTGNVPHLTVTPLFTTGEFCRDICPVWEPLETQRPMISQFFSKTLPI